MFGLVDCSGVKKFALQSVSVQCNIENLLVECTSKFTYRNSTESNAEAMFSFPLEGSCGVYHFEALIGDKRIIGVCKEIEEARNMYQAAKEAGHKTAMIERYASMHDAFKCRIGNFPKNSDAEILLKFVMELNLSLDKSNCSEIDRFSLCLPLILRPRYTPLGYDGDFEVYNVSNKYKYDFQSNISGSKEIKNVFSNHYKLKTIFKDESKTAMQVLLESEYDGSHDLDVNIDYVKMKVPSVIYEYGTLSDHFQGTKINGAFFQSDVVMLNFLPQFESRKPEKKIEIVFIVDRSGSMGGSNIQNAKECLLIFLKSLPTSCKFQIYGFGSTFDKAFEQPQLYDEQSIEIALNYQRQIDADFGGTELMNPLSDMYNLSLTSDYTRIAFLLTDGDVGNQDEVFKLVRTHNHSTRLFTVGIGAGVSTSLVQKVAEFGLGKSAFVRDSKTLSSSVIELLDIALNCDQFSNCKIEWECPKNVSVVTVPEAIKPIFSNYFLTIFCLIRGLHKDDTIKFTLSGQGSGKTISLSLGVSSKTGISDGEFKMHRLLAKYSIDELTAKVEDGKTELKKSLIELSLAANIVTNYTTFVAIDLDIPGTGLIVPDEPRYEMDCYMQGMTHLRGGGGGGGFDQVDGVMDSSNQIYFDDNVLCESDCDNILLESSQDDCYMLQSCVEECSDNYSVEHDGPLLEMADNDYCKSDNNLKTGKKVEDIVMYLAERQNFNGFWIYDEDLITMIKMDHLKIKSEKPESITDNIWITIIIHSYLVNKVASREKEWRLFAKKAREWIENNIPEKSLFENLMKLGQQLIQ